MKVFGLTGGIGMGKSTAAAAFARAKVPVFDADQVSGDEMAMRRLERIMHPLVRQQQRRFLADARRRRARLALLDIPLLLESGRHTQLDLVIVVSAPPDVQRHRIRARSTLSEAQIEALIARQMPDAEKRRRTDVVIRTGLSRAHAHAAIRRLIRRSLA